VGCGVVVLCGGLGGAVAWVVCLLDLGGANALGVGVGFRQERRERTAFVQAELLTRDKQRLGTLQAELKRLSSEDALTGLANRRRFNDTLAREWRRARRSGHSLTLMFVDVDLFKRYNDHYGHGQGDRCLRAVGQCLWAQARRGGDMAARYGGEEFVMLYPNLDTITGIEVVAERLVEGVRALEIPHEASDVAACVTVSAGVAHVAPDGRLAMDTLLQRADQALYEAKEAGRDCWRRYDASHPKPHVFKGGLEDAAIADSGREIAPDG